MKETEHKESKEKNCNSDDTITLKSIYLEIHESNEIAIEKDTKKNDGELKSEGRLGKDNAETKIQLYQCKEVAKIPPPYVIWVQAAEFQQNNSEEWNEPFHPETRNIFIRKVFTILLVCLLITTAFGFAAWFIDPLNIFFQELNPIFLLAPMFIVMGISLALSFVDAARYPPWIYVCLFIVVVCLSFTVAFSTSKTKAMVILYAVIATVVVVIVCLLLACSSFDFTKFMLYVVVIGAALSAICMIYLVATLVFKFYMKPLHVALLIVLTLFNVVTLTIELQMILGGRKHQLEEDEFFFGALILYISIIHMFLKLLQLIRIFHN